MTTPKKVYVVLQNTPPSIASLADLLGGKAPASSPFTIEGVYEDELDAARHAGSTPGTWYTEQPLIPGGPR